MPDLPDSIQVLVKPATTATGTPLLESTDIPKGWDLEIIEQRRDGALVALSPDLNLAGLETSIDNYRRNERTPKGRLKRGSRPVFNLEQIEPSSRLLRIGDELALTDLQPNENYAIDVEIAAGREQPEGAQRRQSFAGYIRNGQAQIIGNGPIVGPDYAAYRVQASGQLISDMLDYHPWVTSVDLPPIVEREATELRNMDEPNLPDFTAPGADAPIIGVIDGGIIPEHPLIRLAVRDQAHRSFISDSILDEGAEGHGTAIVSLVALGSLRGALLNPPEPAVAPVRVALGRLLDRYTQIPTDVVAHRIITEIAPMMLAENGCRVLNHSIASRGLFNVNRMSLWAEAIDSVAYDEGNDGFLFIIPSGNIDGQLSPTINQIRAWLNNPGYPQYLLQSQCRLRNPAQAVNALTVGSYVPIAGVMFHNAQAFGHRAISQSGMPSPFTRVGVGFLNEIKPEVVEEGGNWYRDDGGMLVTRAQHTDVAVANSAFATEGRIVKFVSGTSFAAAKVSNLAGLIQGAIPNAGPDLIRALIVNSASWPERLASLDDTIRLWGYGVPNRERALLAQGPRSLVIIEDSIQIGHAQIFRIPFPHDLFEDNPEIIVRVSVTLAYRAPVRKSNRKYRGTVLEWMFSRSDESLAQFSRRCSTIPGTDILDEDNDNEPELRPGDWDWKIGTRLRTRGTAQKDWFDAAADQFPEELYLAVIGRRGWISKAQQDAGFQQRYAVAISLEVIGAAIPIHERIEALVRVPVRV
jgi:subtilisin family serine protease